MSGCRFSGGGTGETAKLFTDKVESYLHIFLPEHFSTLFFTVVVVVVAAAAAVICRGGGEAGVSRLSFVSFIHP